MGSDSNWRHKIRNNNKRDRLLPAKFEKTRNSGQLQDMTLKEVFCPKVRRSALQLVGVSGMPWVVKKIKCIMFVR